MRLAMIAVLSGFSFEAAAAPAPEQGSSLKKLPPGLLSNRPEISCAAIEHDVYTWIPETMGEIVRESGSGAYGYRKGCNFWVVDYAMNWLSNNPLDPYGNRLHENTRFFGSAFDLPSSLTANGVNAFPGTKDDCENFELRYLIWTRMNNDPDWIYKGDRRLFGTPSSWDPATGACSLGDASTLEGGLSYFETKAPPGQNVLRIRVATRVKERTSWQETAAIARDGDAD